MAKGIFDKRIGVGNKLFFVFVAIFFICFAYFAFSSGKLDGIVFGGFLLFMAFGWMFRGGIGSKKRR